MPLRLCLVSALIALAGLVSPALAEENPLWKLVSNSRRIVFLGDSITAAGPYVTNVEAWLETRPGADQRVVIDAGLPSETVSGLSEEGHANGKFPRPDLAERLDRVLAMTQPDLVVACYGMNCGIYEPYDEGRFARYQAGIRRLRTKVHECGAELILITPPFYDDQRSPRTFSYNAVLDRYARWLLQQRDSGWLVVDLHGPMTREVARRRETDKSFTFQPDGVHPNEAGHWFVAAQLIAALGDEPAAAAETPAKMLESLGVSPEILKPLAERTILRRDAYVGAAGHKRPGIAPGLPIDQAEQKATELTTRIRAALR